MVKGLTRSGTGFWRAAKKLREARAVSARREETSVLSGKVSDLETLCCQLADCIRQMGGLIPPPPHLQIRVGGAYYSQFIRHGEHLLDQLDASLLGSIGRGMTSFNQILDFGCGCARILRALHYRAASPQRLYGSDIDPEAIEWCRANYSAIASFSANDPWPPIGYPENSFDLVYSVSVFTHLPQDMQHAWAKELHRVIMPGGYLLFTTFGEKTLAALPEQVRPQSISEGFLYQRTGDTAGLPSFYQTAFQTPEYIRRTWTDFEPVDVHEQGLDGLQDIVLCRRRPLGT